MIATRTGPSLERRRAVRALLADRRGALVVSGLGSPSYDVFAAGDHDANFYLWGAMGGAAMAGLGLALAQPDRPVIVVTGDGEQLMGMGGLATIAVKRPGNLSVVVIDNARFGETGMQPSHTAYGVDLHRVADVAGFAVALELRTIEEIEGFRAELVRIEGGPRFATVRVIPEAPERVLPPRDGVYLKNRFRRHVGLAGP